MRLSLLVGGIAAISTTFAQLLPPLPEVPGANISRGLPIEKTQLVHYISSNVSFSNATKALIVIHGALRDPWNSFVSGQIATSAAAAEGLLKNEEVVIDAPVFFNQDDAGEFPSNGSVATSNELVWRDSGWMSGDVNQYPAFNTNVSSFAALDALIQYFADKRNFPRMSAIILAGHSAGGQLVQRYALLGNDAPKHVDFRYIVANPSTMAYLNDYRPVPNATLCPTFNDYKYGLANYNLTYGASKLAPSVRHDLISRYLNLPIGHLYGGAPDAPGIPLDTGCEANTQGPTHGTRSAWWLDYLRDHFPLRKRYTYSVAVAGVGHNATLVYASPVGIQALFGTIATLDDSTDKALYDALTGPEEGYSVRLAFNFKNSTRAYQISFTLPGGHSMTCVQGAKITSVDGPSVVLRSDLRKDVVKGYVQFNVVKNETAEDRKVNSFQIASL